MCPTAALEDIYHFKPAGTKRGKSTDNMNKERKLKKQHDVSSALRQTQIWSKFKFESNQK